MEARKILETTIEFDGRYIKTDIGNLAENIVKGYFHKIGYEINSFGHFFNFMQTNQKMELVKIDLSEDFKNFLGGQEESENFKNFFKEIYSLYRPDFFAKKDGKIYIVEVKANSGTKYMRNFEKVTLISKKYGYIPILVTLNIGVEAKDLKIREL